MKKAYEAIPNNKIKQERIQRNWTQKQVAEKIGTSRVNVSRWEHGIVLPDMYFRQQLCDLFDKSVVELGLLPHDAALTPSATPSTPSRLHDLAIPPLSSLKHGLVGRDVLVDTLKQQLCTNQYGACFALHGLPGSGKTALAMVLAHDSEIQEHFPDGVLWAGLGPTPNVPGHLSRWGTALGIVSTTIARLISIESWAEALHTAIGMRRFLLVIDDVWRIEDALTFKIGGPACTYLVTTRFPDIAFQWAAEGATPVHELSEDDGTALLTRLAPQAFAAEPVAMQALVQNVGGLALALTLLGKYVQQLAQTGQPRRLQMALERLRSDAKERLQLTQQQAPLERSPNLPPGMSLSLHAAIATSASYLDTPAQEALQMLSVLPAKPTTFSEAAALAVTNTSVDVLDRLSDAGLLESSGPGRYMLHQTISDYAHLHLKERNPYERLIAYAIRTVEDHAMDYEILDAESSTIFAALERAYTLGYGKELVRCICGFTSFLYLRGFYTLAEPHLQRALEAATSMEEHYLLTKVWRYLGVNAYKRGNYEQAEAYYQKGLTLARQLHDTSQICPLVTCLGTIAQECGAYTLANSYYQEGLALARQLSHYEQMSVLLMNLGVIAHERGASLQAETYYQEALALARQIKHRERISLILLNLGELVGAQRNYLQAQAYLQEGLVLARQIGNPERISSLLMHLGKIASEQGSYEQAQTYFREAQALINQVGKPRFICTLLGERGELLLKLQQWETATNVFYEILTRLHEGNPDLRALAQYGLARVAALQGNVPEARRLAEKSVAIFESLGHRCLNEVRTFLGTVSLSSSEEVSLSNSEEVCEKPFPKNPCCPQCLDAHAVIKSGLNRTGSRRYRCQTCQRYFTPEPTAHGYDAVIKAQALALHEDGNSIRGIARMLGLRHQTINNWIKAQAVSEAQVAVTVLK